MVEHLYLHILSWYAPVLSPVVRTRSLMSLEDGKSAWDPSIVNIRESIHNQMFRLAIALLATRTDMSFDTRARSH